VEERDHGCNRKTTWPGACVFWVSRYFRAHLPWELWTDRCGVFDKYSGRVRGAGRTGRRGGEAHVTRKRDRGKLMARPCLRSSLRVYSEFISATRSAYRNIIDIWVHIPQEYIIWEESVNFYFVYRFSPVSRRNRKWGTIEVSRLFYFRWSPVESDAHQSVGVSKRHQGKTRRVDVLLKIWKSLPKVEESYDTVPCRKGVSTRFSKNKPRKCELFLNASTIDAGSPATRNGVSAGMSLHSLLLLPPRPSKLC